MLKEIIHERIRKTGSISFKDFMEAALYYPSLGYYTSSREQIGKEGDFFTSTSLTPAFGFCIARRLDQMWDTLGTPAFTVVEYGAGTGLLCHDILQYFRENTNRVEHLDYYIIEKSPEMRSRQQKQLGNMVKWCNSIGELSQIRGCVLSNEVLDNFAVHLVEMQKELVEVVIGWEGDFIESTRPANNLLKEYFHELDVQLPVGVRAEVNLEAVEWLKQISHSLETGYLLTIDYGGLSPDLYNERRKSGTLVCFNKHTTNTNPYEHIGEQDITAHVNFSALSHFGKRVGLETLEYTDQANFLLSMGFKDLLQRTLGKGDLLELVRKESFLTRMLLFDMGSRFKVLVQSKGVAS